MNEKLDSWSDTSRIRQLIKIRIKVKCPNESICILECIILKFANKDLYSQSYGFSSTHIQMWELNHKEGWVPKNRCWTMVLENTLETPLNSKEIKPVNTKRNQPFRNIYWKDWLMLKLKLKYFGHLMWKSWLIGKDWKTTSCWERLRTGGERGDREWDSWMASPTRWTWVWAKSRRQWRTGKPGVLQSMESQRVRHDLANEQQWFWTIYIWGKRVITLSSQSWGDHIIWFKPGHFWE